MKTLSFITMLLFSINVFGQVRNFNEISTDILSRLNKMGLDSSSLLNDAESAYFNELFKDSLNVFNFVGKKVGFILSGTRSNKSEYFKEEKDRFNRNYTPNKGTLYIFDKKQKEESGGYDAAIVYWCKFIMPTDKVIKILNIAKNESE